MHRQPVRQAGQQQAGQFSGAAGLLQQGRQFDQAGTPPGFGFGAAQAGLGGAEGIEQLATDHQAQ